MNEVLTHPGSLPLSSLRLIVPPLQLVCAALWEIVKQGAVMYYDLLEEFISTVLETVPELLTYSERAQLVMGLRARVVLELCRSDDFTSPQAIEPHLNKINAFIKQDDETSRFEVTASMTNFLKLVHTLVEDQCQRDIFYQKVFPTVFGLKYDSALQALMRKFIFNLQNFLPVPNLEQTALWLSLSPSVLKECVDFVNQPEHLNMLIQHHKHHGPEIPQALFSSGDNSILSSLAYHLPKVDNDEGTIKSEEEEVENFNTKMEGNVEKNGPQHVEDDDGTEHQGASVEVILQPFDESESGDDDDMGKKQFRHLKARNKTSSKTFKCLVCGKDFDSLSKLKRHKWTHKAHLMKIWFDNTASKRAAHNSSNLKSLVNFERRNDDYSLVCHGCGEGFTCQKNLDTHRRICVVGVKQETQTDPQCSTSSAHHSKQNPVATTKEFFLSETELPNVATQKLISSDSKKSSRVKTCSICGKIFTCASDFTWHMKCHSEQSPYLCSSCGKGFDNYEDCETHQEAKCTVLIQHSQAENDFTAGDSSSNTSKKTRENTVVPRDTAQLPEDAPVSSQACKLLLMPQECGQGFTDYKSLEKNQPKCSRRSPRKTRADIADFTIDGCSFQSDDCIDKSLAEDSLETKESETEAPQNSADGADGSQTKSPSIKCTMCEESFSKIAQMRRHYFTSHKVKDSYPCHLCKRAFVRLGDLVRHQQNRKMYQCAHCKKCYTKPVRLSDHEKVHASATPYICETCGISFTSLSSLSLHQRKHKQKHKQRKPPPATQTLCSYCGKQFSTRECLKAHMVRHTGGYPCQVCGKQFYQKLYLKWHMYKHTGEQQPYQCDKCGKGWPTEAFLKLHMIQHTEERPFRCEDCGVCYKRESHLMSHRRDKHMKLRPVVCDVCSKTFRINSQLKKHMMVHTGERPFTCPKCGKTFTKQCHLKQHREKACL